MWNSAVSCGVLIWIVYRGLKLCLYKFCNFHLDHLHSDFLLFFRSTHDHYSPHPPSTRLTRTAHLRFFIFFPNKFNFASGMLCSHKAQQICNVNAHILSLSHTHTHTCVYTSLDRFSIHLAHTSKHHKPGGKLEKDCKYDYITCSQWLL